MGILIIGNKPDQTIENVIEWIVSMGHVFFWYNFHEFLINFNINFKIINGKNIVDITHIKDNEFIVRSIWFKNDSLDTPFGDDVKNNDIDFRNINLYLNGEISKAKELLFNSSEGIRCLAGYTKTNKVQILKLAENIGLKIPLSLVTNNKNDLKKFMKATSKNQVIMKSIAENLRHNFENNISVFQSVQRIKNSDFSSIPNHFFPTLFQEYIDGKIDIRVVYLNGIFFSMSIHSNYIDCREGFKEAIYNPFDLPIDIKSKIGELMEQLNLNMGSIDLLYCQRDSKYYFLEINTLGEINFVSTYCNYNIEKKIADYLCYGF